MASSTVTLGVKLSSGTDNTTVTGVCKAEYTIAFPTPYGSDKEKEDQEEWLKAATDAKTRNPVIDVDTAKQYSGFVAMSKEYNCIQRTPGYKLWAAALQRRIYTYVTAISPVESPFTRNGASLTVNLPVGQHPVFPELGDVKGEGLAEAMVALMNMRTSVVPIVGRFPDGIHQAMRDEFKTRGDGVFDATKDTVYFGVTVCDGAGRPPDATGWTGSGPAVEFPPSDGNRGLSLTNVPAASEFERDIKEYIVGNTDLTTARLLQVCPLFADHLRACNSGIQEGPADRTAKEMVLALHRLVHKPVYIHPFAATGKPAFIESGAVANVDLARLADIVHDGPRNLVRTLFAPPVPEDTFDDCNVVVGHIPPGSATVLHKTAVQWTDTADTLWEDVSEEKIAYAVCGVVKKAA